MEQTACHCWYFSTHSHIFTVSGCMHYWPTQLCGQNESDSKHGSCHEEPEQTEHVPRTFHPVFGISRIVTVWHTSTQTNMSTTNQNLKSERQTDICKVDNLPQGVEYPSHDPHHAKSAHTYHIQSQNLTCLHPLQYKCSSSTTTTANEWTEHTICVTRQPLTHCPLLTLKRLWGTLSHPQ